MTILVDGPYNYNEQQAGVCFDFPNEVKIDFLLTFRCNAACAHCITESNPHRRESLTRDEVLGVLEAGVRLGKRYVSFTGGEPFLDFPLLLGLVRAAHGLGYYVASDTNAFWGRSPERAKRTVADLREAGLDALFPSADSYHLPWIPLSSVVNIVTECDRQGLTCEVNFIPGPDPDLDAKILDTLDLRDRGYFCDGLSLTGNDVQGLVRLFPHRLAEELTDVGSMHMGISPRGDVYGNVDISYDGSEYLGTPFLLGNLRRESAQALLERELECPTLALARQASPRQVHRWLRHDPELGADYGRELGESRFYSATEFWLALFKSPLRPHVEARLADWGRQRRWEDPAESREGEVSQP
jgi:hypothetical protein